MTKLFLRMDPVQTIDEGTHLPSIAGIQLWSDRDETLGPLVRTSLGGWVKTVDRFALRYSHGDGRVLTLEREMISGPVSFVEVATPLPNAPADLAVLRQLYSEMPFHRGGEAVTWRAAWDEPVAQLLTPEEETFVKTVITAAGYLSSQPIIWQ